VLVKGLLLPFWGVHCSEWHCKYTDKCALFGWLSLTAFSIFNVVFFVFGCNDAVSGTKSANVTLEDEKARNWKKGKRMTLNGRNVRISDPKLVSAPWMNSQHHLLEDRKIPFGQEEASRSSLSLAIFASAPGSPKNPVPGTKLKGPPKSYSDRESHGSIFAYPRPAHIQIHNPGSNDSLPSLPTPPPVYGGRSLPSRGDASPRYVTLNQNSPHSADSRSPTTPRFQTFQTRSSDERDIPMPPSIRFPDEQSDSTPHLSMNYNPSPLATRPPSMTPTVFHRKSTATHLSLDPRRSRGDPSFMYEDDDAESVYTTIDRMASFRSMPRISTGPDFSADWSELGIDVPPVPDIPSRSNTIKSSKAPSLRLSLDPVPSLPLGQFRQESLATSLNLDPFGNSQKSETPSIDEATIPQRGNHQEGKDSRTANSSLL
jgi:hypothetical protein